MDPMHAAPPPPPTTVPPPAGAPLDSLWQARVLIWVVVATEGVAAALTLAGDPPLGRWVRFGLLSLTAQWVALLTLAALYLLRERQFKVMAENAHRESQKRRARTPEDRNAAPFKAGAGGWSSAAKAEPEPEIGQTGNLF